MVECIAGCICTRRPFQLSLTRPQPIHHHGWGLVGDTALQSSGTLGANPHARWSWSLPGVTREGLHCCLPRGFTRTPVTHAGESCMAAAGSILPQLLRKTAHLFRPLLRFSAHTPLYCSWGQSLGLAIRGGPTLARVAPTFFSRQPTDARYDNKKTNRAKGSHFP